MSFSKEAGSAVGAKRLMVVPSLLIRNLVKFHRISPYFVALVLRAFSILWVAFAFKPLYSSDGATDLR